MRFFKSKTNLILCAVIFLLSAALVATSVIIVRKNEKISEIKQLISQNETELGQISEREAELEKKLADSEKNAASISAELEAAKKEKEKLSNEKKKLEEENKSLKKKIEKLSAEKKAQDEAANLAASKPSVPNDGSKVCYLTFDDGPSANTLKILDTLNRYNAKATFFVTKNANISYVKKAYNAGHTVGLHTASHVYSKIYASTDAYYKDLNEISAAVEQQLGIKSKIIRFPGGSSNTQGAKGFMSGLIKSVTAKGYFYFDWNVDSGDAGSAKGNSAAIATNVISASKNKKTVCVLMHDTSAATAKALPAIIEGLAAQGFSFKALTEQSYGFHHGKLY